MDEGFYIEVTDDPDSSYGPRLVTFFCDGHDRYELTEDCCKHEGTIILPIPSPEPTNGCSQCWIILDNFARTPPKRS